MNSSAAPSQRVTALILAGGRSSRMGSDKALLTWKGVPLIQRVFEVAQQCCLEIGVITPWPERYQPLLPSTASWIVEPPTFLGPMAALSLGLESVQTPWVLLLACDMPQLNVGVLQQWIQALPSHAGIAAVPHYQNRWEPLCGFYHVESLPSLKAFLASGNASFQQWLATIRAVPLAVDEAIAPMFYNCNTPTDLVETRH